MIVTIRGPGEELRRAGSFAFSAAIHAAVLGWVAIGAALMGGHSKSIYDQEIRPHQSHIVWYGARNRLPDVSPPAPRVRSPRLRAARKSAQQIVSRSRDNSRPAQTILAPAPEIRLSKPLPLPNILAVTAIRKPPPREFVAPQRKRIAKTADPLPEAPAAPAMAILKDLPVNLPRSAPPVAFTPPEARRKAAATLVLPAAPVIAETAPRTAAPRIPKGFTPPARRSRPETAADAAPAAPDLSTIAPAVATSSLAVVGLKPVELPKMPPPPGSHEAGFSAGPVPHKTGGDADSKDAPVSASGLLVRSGNNDARAALMAALAPPTSTKNLMDALHAAREQAQPAVGFAGLKRSNAPDPRLEGRAVYVMGIQMPNITSESGSWLVWFAEREDEPRARLELRAPVPVRKVDPKYIAAAREERVEGAVRLFAVIRKTGVVDSVELLKSVDPRLDQSAVDALLKWHFQPAMRDGAPVDVEAVFEIPFRLKPRDAR
jgi:TonB family protein